MLEEKWVILNANVYTIDLPNMIKAIVVGIIVGSVSSIFHPEEAIMVQSHVYDMIQFSEHVQLNTMNICDWS